MTRMTRLRLLFVMLLCMFPPAAYAGPYDVPSTIPDTGQTKCYDEDGSEIPCPSPGEDYYGQDANYTIDPPQFTKLADGTVKDEVTGLIWEVKTNKDGTKNYNDPNDADNIYTWYDSNPATNGGNEGTQSTNDTQDFLQALRAKTGYTDWRLPSREELRSIVDYSIPYPGPTINEIYFPNTVSSYYWSSTTYANYTRSAWSVHFYDGGDDHSYFSKSSSRYVRAVRGGQ